MELDDFESNYYYRTVQTPGGCRACPGGSKYGINDGKVTIIGIAPIKGESTDRALVGLESAVDGNHIHYHCTAIDPGLEIERCRAPERAPPPREHLCAGGILAREDGDDAGEDIVWEAAYQVFSSRCQFWVAGFLIQPPLLGPCHHTHLLTTSRLQQRPWLLRSLCRRRCGGEKATASGRI